MEKYLLSSTPTVLLFVTGNWRENTSLIKDYLVLGVMALCTIALF